MEPEITVYGVDHCEDTQRTREHLDDRNLSYRYINLDKDLDADRKVREWNRGKRITPTVVIAGNGRTHRLVEPSNQQLDVVIAGGEFTPAA